MNSALCIMNYELTKMLTKTIHLLTFLLLWHTSLCADPNWRFTHYDDHNGMSQWHLTRVLQDKQGFMWFATWNGLNRYDGYDFAVFKSQPGDGNTLTSDRIRNMQLGDDGNIYCIINNHIWRFNLTTYKFEQPNAATQERYTSRLKIDKEVHPAMDLTVNGRMFEKVRQIFRDSQRNLWVMASYGVHKITAAPQPAERIMAVPEDIVRCMFRDRKGRIWITGRNSGIVTVLDSLTRLIGYLGTDGRLHATPTRFSGIYCITQQRNGNIWLGSKPDGMFCLKETANGVFNIEHFYKGNAAQIKSGSTLNCENVYDIKEDKQGRLWIATHGGGLNIMEVKNGRMVFHNINTDFAKFPKDNIYMRRIMLVGDSLMLATTTEGLIVVPNIKARYRDMRFTLHERESRRAESLSNSATMDMLFDRKGRLFITTESGGVNMLLTKQLSASKFSFRHFNTNTGMGSDVALAMAEAADEILIQCNNQVTRLNADTGEAENFNDLFFSTASRFSDAEPIILSDGRWLLSTEAGVIAMPERNFHQRSYIPRIVMTSLSVPGKVTDYSIEAHDTIHLSPEDRNVIIQYAAIDFTDNTHIKYSTRISHEGKWIGCETNDNWTMPHDTRSISLFDLDPGIYKIEIRSTNAEGLWVDNTRTIYLEVEPTFWETRLATVLYVLLTIFLISGVTYTITYIRTLKRQREENLKAYLRLFETQSKAATQETAATEHQSKAVELSSATTEQAATTEHIGPIMPYISEEDNAFMQRLVTFVEENLGNSEIGVEDIASATATSRSSLNRKTKSLLGVTPADFLKEARIKRACQQLTQTKRGVNDIAYSCGYSDPKYFSKCFKASMGMSPSDYRNSHRNNEGSIS